MASNRRGRHARVNRDPRNINQTNTKCNVKQQMGDPSSNDRAAVMSGLITGHSFEIEELDDW